MRTLNLNNYDIVGKDEATLKIVPKELEDGTQPPAIYLRSNKRNANKPVTVADIEEGTAVWSPTVRIDTSGSPKDYIRLIRWWFEQSGKDEDYVDGIQTKYHQIKDVVEEVLKAKYWLTETAAYRVNAAGEYFKRPEQIGRFLKGWMSRVIKRTYGGVKR